MEIPPKPSDQTTPTTPADARPRLSTELAEIRKRLATSKPPPSSPDQTDDETATVTLNDVIGTLQGRTYTLLLILLALPFTTPLPLPGLSTPFGLAIAIIAFRLMFGMRPWLPESMRQRPLPPGFFERLFKLTERILKFFERFLHPRLSFLTSTALWRSTHALLILVSAIVLLLPLPIPFSNTFPAWVILLTAGGLLERDGRAILCAYAVALGGLLFFIFLGEMAQEAFEALRTWWLQR